MAGHSQFKNIMHRKGAQDSKRAKLFTKLVREIIVAAKAGPDPGHNARLRAAVIEARANNLPKDKIEGAIKKGSSPAGGEDYEEVRYEGYGTQGVALIVEALTDNRNRTASDVRSTFTKMGGSLGETGSVSFMFDRVGLIEFPKSVANDEVMLEAVIEAGALSCDSYDDVHEVISAQGDFSAVRDYLTNKFGEPITAKLIWRPQNRIQVSFEVAEKILKLVSALDELDDVQEVYGNYEFDEETIKKLSS